VLFGDFGTQVAIIKVSQQDSTSINNNNKNSKDYEKVFCIGFRLFGIGICK
jgi:hypothetical protein